MQASESAIFRVRMSDDWVSVSLFWSSQPKQNKCNTNHVHLLVKRLYEILLP